MYTSLDTQGRLSARLLSAQARSACLFSCCYCFSTAVARMRTAWRKATKGTSRNHRGEHHPVYLPWREAHGDRLRSSAVSVRGDFLSLQNA